VKCEIWDVEIERVPDLRHANEDDSQIWQSK